MTLENYLLLAELLWIPKLDQIFREFFVQIAFSLDWKPEMLTIKCTQSRKQHRLARPTGNNSGRRDI